MIACGGPVIASVRPSGMRPPFATLHRNALHMSGKNDSSIDHIVLIANNDVRDAICRKIGRSLTNDETEAISAIIGTEHFWTRAEELLMFVRHKDVTEVQIMVAKLKTRFREGMLPTNDEARERPARVIHCDMCSATGVCYCIRKGQGTADGCPRCDGTEKCRHCNGTGAR